MMTANRPPLPASGVLVPSEFFDPLATVQFFDCKLLGPAEPNVVDGVDLHEACWEVRHIASGKVAVVCSDYLF